MSYENFSYYYDSLMDPQFYDDYLTFIHAHATFTEVVELGCGTGEIAIRLAKQGYPVLATDLSQTMIDITREKSLAQDVDMLVERVDMTDFMLSRTVSCVLCLCDSLNYVLEREGVLSVFRNVAQSLSDGGTFIFDVNSLYKCHVILDDYHEEANDEDFYFRWDVTTDHHGGITHHVVIEDYENQERVDEIHHQKSYLVSDYMDMLEEAGFHHVELYSDFGPYKETCERIIFVCQKEAKNDAGHYWSNERRS